MPPSFFRPADCIGNTIHTLIKTKRVTSAASVPAAAADKAKRRPSGASASGRARSPGRSVPVRVSAPAWAAPARLVPAAARWRTAVAAPAPHPRHYAIASCRPGSPLVAAATAKDSRRSSPRKASRAGSRRRRCSAVASVVMAGRRSVRTVVRRSVRRSSLRRSFLRAVPSAVQGWQPVFCWYYAARSRTCRGSASHSVAALPKNHDGSTMPVTLP